MGDSVALDTALDELGMLSSVSKYKMEFIQSIEAKLEERRAQERKAQGRIEEITRCGNSEVFAHTSSEPVRDPNNQPQGSEMMLCRGEPPRITVDSSFVTSISLHQSPRFTGSQHFRHEIRSIRSRLARGGGSSSTIQYSSPYIRQIITVPPSSRSTPYPGPNNLLKSCLYQPPESRFARTTATLKLSGVLTSFRHRARPCKSRARVRFSGEEEQSTEDLTNQLANIKLDLSSLKSSDSNSNVSSFTQLKPYRQERYPYAVDDGEGGGGGVRQRSRLFSLGSTQESSSNSVPSLSCNLSSSLTRLDIKDE